MHISSQIPAESAGLLQAARGLAATLSFFNVETKFLPAASDANLQKRRARHRVKLDSQAKLYAGILQQELAFDEQLLAASARVTPLGCFNASSNPSDLIIELHPTGGVSQELRERYRFLPATTLRAPASPLMSSPATGSAAPASAFSLNAGSAGWGGASSSRSGGWGSASEPRPTSARPSSIFAAPPPQRLSTSRADNPGSSGKHGQPEEGSAWRRWVDASTLAHPLPLRRVHKWAARRGLEAALPRRAHGMSVCAGLRPSLRRSAPRSAPHAPSRHSPARHPHRQPRQRKRAKLIRALESELLRATGEDSAAILRRLVTREDNAREDDAREDDAEPPPRS